MKQKLILLFSLFASLSSCGYSEGNLQNKKVLDDMSNSTTTNSTKMIDTLTIGGGCFWCVEAQLQLLDGVKTVKSGYAGGQVKNPSYKEVCTGLTGHAEVIQVTFDNSVLTLDELLAAFWQAHDPTQLNRQGNDVGTQYRSVIFYRNDEQKKLAEDYKKKLNDEKVYDKPVVTEISPLDVFYPAENYHQNYYNDNSSQGYCQYVIAPKLEKFRKVFKEKIKK
jgi:peptide-methionine (S)-S-oxide reductase